DKYVKENARPEGTPMDIAFNSPHPLLVGYPKIKWSIDGSPKGASIDENTGVLSITSDIKVPSVTVVAESNGVINKMELSVANSSGTTPTKIKVKGPLRIGVESGKEFKHKYDRVITDDFGTILHDVQGIVWEVKSDIEGVNVDNEGNLKISAAAASNIVKSGGVSVLLSAKSITNMMLKDTVGIFIEAAAPTNVETNFGSKLQIKANTDNFIELKAHITDQNKVPVDDTNVKKYEWTISEEMTKLGFEILTDENGKQSLKIPANLPTENYKNLAIFVSAELNDGNKISNVVEFEITEERIPFEVKVSGNDTIKATSANINSQYTGTVYDRFGEVVSAQNLTWSYSPQISGVYFNTDTDSLVVAPEAANGNVAITAMTDDGVCGSMSVKIVKNDEKPEKPSKPTEGGGGGGGVSSGGGGAVSPLPTPTATPGPSEETLRFSDVPHDYWAYEFVE
ncbi:MAG: hypothetical protein RSC29_00495, partial [Oscillospiraceae bacterium]